MGAVQLRLFGPARIEGGSEGSSPFRSHKTVALLGYLAAQARPVARERLAGLLWGEMPQAAARQELRRALHNLSTLLPGSFDSDRSMLAFVPGPGRSSISY